MKALFLLPSLVIFFAGCDQTPLPNGYSVFVASSSEIYLQSNKDDLVVGPNVSDLGNEGNLIFGKVEPRPRTPLKESDTTGYFVLDTVDGSLKKGLTKAEWLEDLKKRGVVDEPKLTGAGQKRPRGDWQ